MLWTTSTFQASVYIYIYILHLHIIPLSLEALFSIADTLENYETRSDSWFIFLPWDIYVLLVYYFIYLILNDHTLRSNFIRLALAELHKLCWIKLSSYNFSFLLKISHYWKHWNSTQNSTPISPISVSLCWRPYIPLWVPSPHFMNVSSWILKFDLSIFIFHSSVNDIALLEIEEQFNPSSPLHNGFNTCILHRVYLATLAIQMSYFISRAYFIHCFSDIFLT